MGRPTMGGVQQAWLTFIGASLNHATGWLARHGVGPFSLIRTTGRRSGRSFETPLVLARVPDGFVCELTYGDGVDWYRNLVAAERRGARPIGIVVWRAAEYPVERLTRLPADAGLAAFGGGRRLVLRMLRRREFRLLHVTGG